MTRTGWLFAAAVVIVLAGCSDESVEREREDILFVEGQGSADQLGEEQRNVAKLAIETLAKELNVPGDEILVDTIRAVQWRDSSIGCPQPGRSYLQVITPGHKITLRVAGQVHVVHEANGRAMLCKRSKAVRGVTPQLELVWGEQIVEAREDLASRLGVAVEDIRLLGASPHTWDNEGLGCPDPATTYRSRPVEGYVLRLGHDGRRYTYHTDLHRTIPCPRISED